MLHAKVHGNRSAGSGEENFEGFLPYMGMAAILVMSPASYYKIILTFNTPIPS